MYRCINICLIECYLDVSVGLKLYNFTFLEIFQKLPGESSKPPGGSYPFVQFWVPGEGTAWRHIPGRQATHRNSSVFLGLDEALGGSKWTARRREQVLARINVFGDLGCFWSVRKLLVVINKWFWYRMTYIFKH